jgi:hypothetical protein
MENLEEYPTVPTVMFTEDEWRTTHEGSIIKSSIYGHLVRGIGYGEFWIPKCRVKNKTKNEQDTTERN